MPRKPQAMAAMAELRELAEEKRTCLLCFCRDYDKCHRSLLFDELFAGWERIDLVPALPA